MALSNHCLAAASALLALAFVTFAPRVAEGRGSTNNDQILAGVEPFEELAETALSGDARKIEVAFKEADKRRAATRALLPAANAARYDTLFTALQAAQTIHDNLGVALLAAELYKVGVSSLDAPKLTVPMEVSLLDYSGFRTNVLLKVPAQDWAAIAATAQEANGYWAKVRDRVADKRLQSRMSKAQQDLAEAARTHNAALSKSAAKINLDLVDELESYFSKTGKK